MQRVWLTELSVTSCLLASEVAAHAQLREELGVLARAASDGGAESLAAAAMQQALLAILDGEENEADELA